MLIGTVRVWGLLIIGVAPIWSEWCDTYTETGNTIHIINTISNCICKCVAINQASKANLALGGVDLTYCHYQEATQKPLHGE